MSASKECYWLLETTWGPHIHYFGPQGGVRSRGGGHIGTEPHEFTRDVNRATLFRTKEDAKQFQQWMQANIRHSWLAWKVTEHEWVPPRAAPEPPAEHFNTLQAGVKPWLDACFGPAVAADRVERNHRFIEEALELVQACGCTREHAHQIVDYVYGRPTGDPFQEVGGVMVTLAALCLATGLDMDGAGAKELQRVWFQIEQIRAKQAAKKNDPALPGGASQPPSPDDAQYAARYKQLCQNIIDAKKRAGHVFGLTLAEIDQCIDDAIKMGVYSSETKEGGHV